MSFDALRNVLRGDARRADRAAVAYPRSGTVTAYDPARPAVKVQIEPEGFETGWMPVRTVWAGPGWGLFAGPVIGAEVEVHFQEGGRGAGYAALFGWSAATPSGQTVPSGEFWLVHKNGQYIKLTNDGKVLIGSGTEIDVGNLANGLHQIVTDALVSLFNGHTHQVVGVQAGSATVTSQAPGQQMGQAHLTQILKAN